MMMPSIFRENLFDDLMRFPFDDDFFKTPAFRYDNQAKSVMKTDVKETEQGYEVAIDLPGFKKENIHAELNNGYLTISASQNVENDEKDDHGNFIRRERYTGNMSRSFYVGEGIRQEDIHAKLDNGILQLTFPKMDAHKVEEKKYISIEG